MDEKLRMLNEAKFAAVKQHSLFKLLVGKKEIYHYINNIKRR